MGRKFLLDGTQGDHHLDGVGAGLVRVRPFCDLVEIVRRPAERCQKQRVGLEGRAAPDRIAANKGRIQFRPNQVGKTESSGAGLSFPPGDIFGIAPQPEDVTLFSHLPLPLF